MSTVAQLDVAINADSSKAINDLNGFQSKMQSMAKGLSDIGGKLTTFVTLPLLGAAGGAFKMASDMSESVNKVDVAFGESSGVIKDWADNTLNSIGVAKGTALDMAALFGDMGSGMGLAQDKAADMSMSLVTLAGDMASFKNISVDRAQTALAGIFTGETEALKGLGVVMTQANLEAFAMSQGIETNIKDMTQAEQVQLRYAYVMNATKNSQGDFARTSEGAANQMRIMTESIKEVAASFGEILLPIITPIIQKINEWIQGFKDMDDGQKKLIVQILTFVAVLGPVLLILGKVIAMVVTGIGIWQKMHTAGTALNVLFTTMTGPVGIWIAAIAAVIAIGIFLWQNWDSISAWLKEIWAKIVQGVTEMTSGFVTAIQGMVSSVVGFFKNLWEGIKNVFMSFMKGGVLGLVNDYILKPFFGIDLFEIGKQVIEGFWNGIKGMGSWLGSKVKGFFDGFTKGIKDFFGIKSPSKMFIGFGENISAGLGKGITGNIGVVEEASTLLTQTVDTEFNLPDSDSIDLESLIGPGKNDSTGKPFILEIRLGSASIFREIIDGINREQRYAGKTLIDV